MTQILSIFAFFVTLAAADRSYGYGGLFGGNFGGPGFRGIGRFGNRNFDGRGVNWNGRSNGWGNRNNWGGSYGDDSYGSYGEENDSYGDDSYGDDEGYEDYSKDGKDGKESYKKK